jgi:hypothetical protein
MARSRDWASMEVVFLFFPFVFQFFSVAKNKYSIARLPDFPRPPSAAFAGNAIVE